jgi:hypothetical protein
MDTDGEIWLQHQFVAMSLSARRRGLMPDTVWQLKRAGMRVAFWFPDVAANMRQQLMLLAPYDAIFFKAARRE